MNTAADTRLFKQMANMDEFELKRLLLEKDRVMRVQAQTITYLSNEREALRKKLDQVLGLNATILMDAEKVYKLLA